MGWMKFLSFVFNLVGCLFVLGAVAALLMGVAIGGAANGSGETSALTAAMGGMMGTIAFAGNLFGSLIMFFFGAVLWALHRLLEETARGSVAVS